MENRSQSKGGEPAHSFLDKKKTLDIIKRIHDEGWIDDIAYNQCMECVRKKRGIGDSIKCLELPPRVYCSLSRSGVQTVDQLRYMLLGNQHPVSKRDFFDIRNLGMKTAMIILEKALQNEIIGRDEIGIYEHGSKNHTKWEMCRILIAQTRQQQNE